MQAARGTALSHDDSDATGRRAGRGPYLLAFGVVAAAGYAVDQVSKSLAVEHLSGRPDVPVLGTFLQLHLTRNPGAAFSAGANLTELISVVAIVATVVILVLALRVRNGLWAVGLGVLLAGVTGNLTDRLLREPGPLRGHVIDFLMLPNWPVFNVADICINVAAGVIILQAFRGVRLDGTREERKPERDAA